MQKLLYPYLPEGMRNPQTFEWMMSNPEYRTQLEQMMEKQVCSAAGHLLKRKEQKNRKSPPPKQVTWQFWETQKGLLPRFTGIIIRHPHSRAIVSPALLQSHMPALFVVLSPCVILVLLKFHLHLFVFLQTQGSSLLVMAQRQTSACHCPCSQLHMQTSATKPVICTSQCGTGSDICSHCGILCREPLIPG